MNDDGYDDGVKLLNIEFRMDSEFITYVNLSGREDVIKKFRSLADKELNEAVDIVLAAIDKHMPQVLEDLADEYEEELEEMEKEEENEER